MFGYFKRSLDVAKETGAKILKADPLPWSKEQLLLSLNSQEDLKKWAIGCDKDIGGYSNASLELTPEGKAKFSGNISLELPKNNSRIEKSGYAAIKSKSRGSTLFGTPCWDTTLYRYLSIRAKGDNKKYLVNIQTDGPVISDLFQHRLFLRKPGEWETIMIPFTDFILTNHGVIQEPQIEMYRERVRTIGISLLMQPGPFCLELDWIKMINTDETIGDYDRIHLGR
ncbi:CIA30-domain-containing protein [Gigaspora margarita]|uniref:CIA30-domain-containing protein n=1 Tax=Gigaspora margarita TaxID=4874 RepID=A0A8H4A1A1_GIGMA|nr:CIA30-domain-containing protein [Gigaspora margarita]